MNSKEDGMGTLIDIIIMVATIAVIVAAIIFIMKRNKKKRSCCRNCGVKFDYENDIEWSVTSTYVKNNSMYQKVRILCHCPNCGETKEMYKEIRIAGNDGVNGSGHFRHYDLENQIRHMFL